MDLPEPVPFERNKEGVLKPTADTWRLKDYKSEWAYWNDIEPTTKMTVVDLRGQMKRRDLRATTDANVGRYAVRLDRTTRAWLGWEWLNYYQPKREIFRLLDFAYYMSVEYATLAFKAKQRSDFPLYETQATRKTAHVDDMPIRYTRVCNATRRIAGERDQLLLAPDEEWYPRSDYSRKANEQLTPHIY